MAATETTERKALRYIAEYPAGSNSDPDVMADALDNIGFAARKALDSKPPRLVVVVEGGLVAQVLSSVPGVAVHICDYDTEGEDSNRMAAVPQVNRPPACACLHPIPVEVNEIRVEEIVNSPPWLSLE